MRRTAGWRRPCPEIGPPLIGLAPGHGPAQHQGDALHAERLGQQPMLACDIVVGGDHGETRAVERRRRVARRGRQAVAEHVDRHDEPARRVERRHRPQVALVAGVGAGVEGGHDDDVAAARVERAVRLVGEPCVGQRGAGLQRHVAELEYIVVRRHFESASLRRHRLPGRPAPDIRRRRRTHRCATRPFSALTSTAGPGQVVLPLSPSILQARSSHIPPLPHTPEFEVAS